MTTNRLILSLAWLFLAALGLRGQGADTSQMRPLTDLGSGTYQGYPGGLYPGGSNQRPAAHESAGLAAAASVGPLNRDGQPDPSGQIVLLSIGMSNTSLEFSAFVDLANADSRKNSQLMIVDGAHPGSAAQMILNPDDGGSGSEYWSIVDARLQDMGVTRAQVQVAWLKEADANPSQGFPGQAVTLQSELQRIVQLMRSRFPNLKMVYLASRIYAGFSVDNLNPEPYAYETGFAVKWLIERQIQGDAQLDYSASGKAPWLGWGPYTWANGTTPRADGLTWTLSDFMSDGGHPAPSGRQKVAQMLWSFFSTDTTTRGWFLGNGRVAPPSIPAITGPAPRSTLSSSTVTFTWSAGTGVTQYGLSVGSIQGASDLFSQDMGSNQSVTVSGLPTDGRNLYVQLWYLSGGVWRTSVTTFQASAR